MAPLSSSTQGVGQAHIVSCIANLSNTILGAGLLGLPSAYSSAGSSLGTILLTSSSLLSLTSLHLLSKSAQTIGITPTTQSSFYTVANAAYPSLAVVIDAAVALKCLGVATGYLITVSDSMIDVFKYLNYTNNSLLIQRSFWVPVAVAACSTLSFFKSLDKLKFTSVVSVVFVVVLALVIWLYSIDVEGFDPCSDYIQTETETDSDTCKGPVKEYGTVSGTMKNLTIFIFSFTCHQNIFAVNNELSNLSMVRIDIVIFASILLAYVIYLLVSTAGYETFGDNVNSDILTNYPQNNLVSWLRVMISLLVVFSYPLQLDPSRRCVMSLIQTINGERSGNSDESGNGDGNGNGDEESFDMESIDEEGESKVSDRDREDDGERGVKGYTKLNTPTTDSSLSLSLPSSSSSNTKATSTKSLSSTTSSTTASSKSKSPPYNDNHPLLLPTSKPLLAASNNNPSLTFNTFNLITTSFLLLTLLLSLLIPDLGTVLSIVGATGSTVVSYILPGTIYLKICGGENRVLDGLAVGIVGVGCVVMPTALFFIFFG